MCRAVVLLIKPIIFSCCRRHHGFVRSLFLLKPVVEWHLLTCFRAKMTLLSIWMLKQLLVLKSKGLDYWSINLILHFILSRIQLLLIITIWELHCHYVTIIVIIFIIIILFFSSYLLIFLLKELCREISLNLSSGNNTNLSETKISAQNMKIMYKQHNKYKNEELGMDSVTKDWNGWQLCFLKTYYPKCFPNFICVVCNVWYNAWETYLFDTMQSCDFVIFK